MPAVNPEILRWARESAGLAMEEAARKLQIGAGAARLEEYEAGVREPSRSIILRMAKQYRRPLIAFYSAAPPPRGDRGEDFRNLPEQQTIVEPLVDALVRDVRARQAMVRSVMEEEETAVVLPFVGSMTMESGVGPVLASIRQRLGIDREEFRAQGTREAAFGYLRSRAEGAGVFVLLIGNLGSHHTNLDVSAFRGFALADPVAPFVVINDQDARAAWSFTLLHEIAHIWIGATGISGGYGESRLERFCNDVASEFLLENAELAALRFEVDGDLEQAAAAITEFAKGRLVSRSLVAYRLFRAGRINAGAWTELVARFREEWRTQRDEQRARARERAGGPDYYVVRRHKLGGALLRFVGRTVAEGLLTATKAGKVLGVKPRSVAPLLGERQGPGVGP